DAEPFRVLGRNVDGLAAMQRRRVSARLDARVVALETTTGREHERILLVRLFDRGVVLDRVKGSELSFGRILPQARVQELLTGVLLVRAGPLQPTTRVQPLV